MEKQLRFYREDNKWYVDLPEWVGEKSDLQMVWGADELLDIISNYTDNMVIIFSNTYKENYDVLLLHHICAENTIDEPSEGAFYFIKEYNGTKLNLNFWLCDVTKYVFDDFPNQIWIKKIKPQ